MPRLTFEDHNQVRVHGVLLIRPDDTFGEGLKCNVKGMGNVADVGRRTIPLLFNHNTFDLPLGYLVSLQADEVNRAIRADIVIKHHDGMKATMKWANALVNGEAWLDAGLRADEVKTVEGVSSSTIVRWRLLEVSIMCGQQADNREDALADQPTGFSWRNREDDEEERELLIL